jgi:hypothetical protein
MFGQLYLAVPGAHSPAAAASAQPDGHPVQSRATRPSGSPGEPATAGTPEPGTTGAAAARQRIGLGVMSWAKRLPLELPTWTW